MCYVFEEGSVLRGDPRAGLAGAALQGLRALGRPSSGLNRVNDYDDLGRQSRRCLP